MGRSVWHSRVISGEGKGLSYDSKCMFRLWHCCVGSHFFAKICRLRGFKRFLRNGKVDQFGVSRIKFAKLWHQEGGERSRSANRFRRLHTDKVFLLLWGSINAPRSEKKESFLRKTQSEITWSCWPPIGRERAGGHTWRESPLRFAFIALQRRFFSFVSLASPSPRSSSFSVSKTICCIRSHLMPSYTLSRPKKAQGKGRRVEKIIYQRRKRCWKYAKR